MAITETTMTSAKAWSPDISSFAAADAVPTALVLTNSTVAGHIEGDEPALRVAWLKDAAADTVPEGTEIPEADPVLAETVVQTLKVATLLKVSREQWVTGNAADLLSASVRRAVTSKADELFLTRPAGDAPEGLTVTSGIIDGGTTDGDLDAIVDAVATITANGAMPTGIIASPTAWATLRKMKTSTGAATSILGAGTEDAAPRLLGLPVTMSRAIPAGQLLIVDSTAIVSAVGDVKVSTSEHVYFGSDNIGLRCTWRIGWGLMHPDRIAKLTVSAGA